MGSGAAAPRPLLAWQEGTRQDDQGKNATRERCFVAYDDQGCEWIVAPHDDGSWNWMRWDGGVPLAVGTGHKDADAALAAANAYAAKELAT